MEKSSHVSLMFEVTSRLKKAEEELNAINRKIDWQNRRLHYLYEEHFKFGGVQDFEEKKRAIGDELDELKSQKLLLTPVVDRLLEKRERRLEIIRWSLFSLCLLVFIPLHIKAIGMMSDPSLRGEDAKTFAYGYLLLLFASVAAPVASLEYKKY